MATRLLRISNKSGILSVFEEADAQWVVEVRVRVVRLLLSSNRPGVIEGRALKHTDLRPKPGGLLDAFGTSNRCNRTCAKLVEGRKGLVVQALLMGCKPVLVPAQKLC